MNINEEKILVQKCLNGEKSAWDEFVTQYTRLIYNSIYRALEFSGYELAPDLIEDLHQDVFLGFIKDDYAKLRKFGWRNGSRLATWIGVVTRHLVLDYIRKESRKRDITQSVDAPIGIGKENKLIDTLEDKEASIDRILDKKENNKIFKKAIESLSEEDRQLLELLYFQEAPYEEIAKILGKSVDAIYMQKSRVSDKMKEIIKKLS